MFPFPATSRYSLLVGKIKEGDELKVLWYMQEESYTTPSVYVWKGWLSQAFKLKWRTRVRVPDKGKGLVEYRCATFPNLLPHFWGVLLLQVYHHRTRKKKREKMR